MYLSTLGNRLTSLHYLSWGRSVGCLFNIKKVNCFVPSDEMIFSLTNIKVPLQDKISQINFSRLILLLKEWKQFIMIFFLDCIFFSNQSFRFVSKEEEMLRFSVVAK